MLCFYLANVVPNALLSFSIDWRRWTVCSRALICLGLDASSKAIVILPRCLA